jgi:hypothetical protein
LVKLASLALTQGWTAFDHRSLAEALRFCGVKKFKDPVAATISAQTWDADKVLAHLLAQCFWTETSGPQITVQIDNVVAITVFLQIDLASEWDGGTIASPQGYWDMHTKEQLLAIAKEVKLLECLSPHNDCQEITANGLSAMRKSDLVATLMKAMGDPDDKEAGIPMPKEITKAKPPKK